MDVAELVGAVLVLVAAGVDLRTRQVPNVVSVAPLPGLLVGAFLAGHGWLTLSVTVFVLVLMFALFLTGQHGMGDVKLAGLAAAAFSPTSALLALMVALVSGHVAARRWGPHPWAPHLAVPLVLLGWVGWP